VDPLTHGLASFALQRGFFPRASWRAVVTIVAGGLLADIDFISASFGPPAYLRWNRTVTHSLVFVVVLAVLAFLFIRRLSDPARAAKWTGLSWIAIGAAALLHLVMDSFQADSSSVLWPFSSRRFALDVAPAIDPWLLVILVSAVLFPEIVRLVSDEIGSRSKRPRGRVGAITGLCVALVYFGARSLFHANVTATLESHVVSGEMPRRAAAFPDSISPFVWHGAVETISAVHLTTIRSMGGEAGYASGITTWRKPEPSMALSASQSSAAAVEFLKTTRFPKATVEQENEGYSVEIRDLKNEAMQMPGRAILAHISLDKSAKVISSELQWQTTHTNTH
jgi:inner membrane protein